MDRGIFICYYYCIFVVYLIISFITLAIFVSNLCTSIWPQCNVSCIVSTTLMKVDSLTHFVVMQSSTIDTVFICDRTCEARISRQIHWYYSEFWLHFELIKSVPTTYVRTYVRTYICNSGKSMIVKLGMLMY